MQDEFLVHTREGEDCLRCGGTIRRIVVDRPLDLLLPRLPGAAAGRGRGGAAARA